MSIGDVEAVEHRHGRLLGRHRAGAQDHVRLAMRDARSQIGPWDLLLDAHMGGATDLASGMEQEQAPAVDQDVTPLTGRRSLPDDRAPPFASGAPAAALERRDGDLRHTVRLAAQK